MRFAGIDPYEVLQNIFEETSPEAIKLNKKRLHDKGTDKNGVKLQYPYSTPYYTKKKLALNPIGVTDLEYTGAWYNSLYAEVTRDVLNIKSNGDPEKDERLDGLYGEDIKGLSDDDKVVYGNTIVLPRYIAYIRNVTQL